MVAGSVSSTAPISAPSLTNTGNLAGMTNSYGTAGTNPPSFTLTGTNLTGDVALSASSGFEISQTAGGGSGYAASQTLLASNAKVSNAVYVRLIATNPVGNYSGYVLCNTTNSAGLTVVIPTNTVTKKDISITGLTGVDKVYDGTTSASFSGTPAYDGLVNGEAFNVVGSPSATFASATVQAGKTVTVTGLSAPTANYNLLPVNLTAAITAQPLTLSGLSADDKTYNGTVAATLSGIPQLVGVVSVDTGNVSVSGTPTASFVSANVGGDIPILVSGYFLSGSAASNYSLTQPSDLVADINPKSATVTASDRTKTVGQTLVLGPNQTSGFSASGLVGGETVDRLTLTASGGTAAEDAIGSYTITPSDAAALPSIPPNPFRPENYLINYVAGTLQVVDAATVTKIEDWASQKGLTGDNALPNADPDGDGMSNLMEYFLGLDPSKSGGSSGPVMTLTNGPSNTVSMTYRRAKGLTNVESAVQTIGNLSSTNWGTNGVQESVTDKGDYEEVTATVTNAPG